MDRGWRVKAVGQLKGPKLDRGSIFELDDPVQLHVGRVGIGTVGIIETTTIQDPITRSVYAVACRHL